MTARRPRWRRLDPAFLALMFAAFVESLGSFLVLALIPYYGRELGATPSVVGWLVAAFSLAQLVSAPLWGRLSDRLGRKGVLVAGLVITAGAHLLFAFAGSVLVLFVSRVLQGLGAGTVSVVLAYLGDVLPARQRAEGIGWVTAATSGAAMVGPVVGSFAARFDPTYPGLWSFGLAVVSLLMVWRLLPSVSIRAQEDCDDEGGEDAGGSLAAALFEVVRRPMAAGPLLVWTYAVGMLATSATFGVVGLDLERRFGVDETSIWWFFSLLAGVSLVLRVWALGPLVRRFGEARLVVVGAALLGLATLGLPLPGTEVLLVGPILLFALGQSLLYPCATALLSQVAERRRAGLLGQAMGVQQAYGGTSRVLGPVLGGAAFGVLGPSVPFLVTGGLVLAWSLILARAWLEGSAASAETGPAASRDPSTRSTPPSATRPAPHPDPDETITRRGPRSEKGPR